ncbi:uncharacterized protein LOC125242579 [Leguminivora glycinivorella]|uniref:uncharacterized protein LOC125235860 n=1 Tax=Leguminivora glycinivorella TaxID=1035111 RepID=UPI00200C624C|nr:uncharacterized protein LOC125235860 [Leguminivora glycinivorella]XP_048007317.1 uncharacterized protein LOC125242579 [Leguminivora glycinivorella]XP_048007318.1 uncharacterized protein LOC125242579 [Leguminivora glycinivorella]XP_048007319.1 uncharacterized protein LOC125242579 [Leguminivora glycinivorella]
MENLLNINNKTKTNTASAAKRPERVEVREGGKSADGPPIAVESGLPSSGEEQSSLQRRTGQGTPDVLQLEGLSLSEEAELLRSPKRGVTEREATPAENGPFYKYQSKAQKKKAKVLRRKAAIDGERGGVPVVEFKGDAKPGPSKRGLKMKRQSTDEGRSERPPAKRQNQGRAAADGPRNVARANRGLAVAVGREDGAPVDEALAKLIRKKLTQLIEVVVLQVVRGEPGVVAPRFAASGLVSEGFFLVTPKSTESRDWLLGQDFGELDGHRIIVRKLEQTRVQVWVPGDADTEYVKEFLYAQNPDRRDLKFLEWKAAGRDALELGTRLTFLVPDGVEEIWGEEKTKVMDFSATSVRVRILRANITQQPSEPNNEEPELRKEGTAPSGVNTEEKEGMDVVDGGELSE